jgi:hypothetical protein
VLGDFYREAGRTAIVAGMRLGYFAQPVHPPAKDYRQVLKEDRTAILLAEELGYVEAFIGEHITDWAEPMELMATECHASRQRGPG